MRDICLLDRKNTGDEDSVDAHGNTTIQDTTQRSI